MNAAERFADNFSTSLRVVLASAKEDPSAFPNALGLMQTSYQIPIKAKLGAGFQLFTITFIGIILTFLPDVTFLVFIAV